MYKETYSQYSEYKYLCGLFLAFTEVMLFVFTTNVYSQPIIRVQEKAIIQIVDRFGNTDSVTIGFGSYSLSNRSYPFSNDIDSVLQQEVDISNYTNSPLDIRIIHDTSDMCNSAIGEVRGLTRPISYSFGQKCQLKYDLRSSRFRAPDWLAGEYQPFNIKITADSFPVIIKVKHSSSALVFSLRGVVTNPNCSVITKEIENIAFQAMLQNGSSNSYLELDTIYTANELITKKYDFCYKFNYVTVKAKLDDDLKIHITTEGIQVDNFNNYDGNITIFNLLGQKLSNYELISNVQVLPQFNQPVILSITTNKKSWKHVILPY